MSVCVYTAPCPACGSDARWIGTGRYVLVRDMNVDLRVECSQCG